MLITDILNTYYQLCINSWCFSPSLNPTFSPSPFLYFLPSFPSLPFLHLFLLSAFSHIFILLICLFNIYDLFHIYFHVFYKLFVHKFISRSMYYKLLDIYLSFATQYSNKNVISFKIGSHLKCLRKEIIRNMQNVKNSIKFET